MPMPNLKKLPNQALRLNLGCGSNKIPDYINIDMEKSLKPDVCMDFTQARLPFKDNTVDEVVLFHTIEHINKKKHRAMLAEIRRVLKVGARLIITYPQFDKCYENWKKNWRGKREFWEATIFGRQAFPSDFHVCIMMPLELQRNLETVGFERISHRPEMVEKYNTITVGYKSRRRYAIYEEHLRSLKYKLTRVK